MKQDRDFAAIFAAMDTRAFILSVGDSAYYL